MSKAINERGWVEHGRKREPSPEYYTVAEVAALFRVSDATVRRWCQPGSGVDIPCIKFGTTAQANIRIPRKEFDAWRQKRVTRRARMVIVQQRA